MYVFKINFKYSDIPKNFAFGNVGNSSCLLCFWTQIFESSWCSFLKSLKRLHTAICISRKDTTFIYYCSSLNIVLNIIFINSYSKQLQYKRYCRIRKVCVKSVTILRIREPRRLLISTELALSSVSICHIYEATKSSTVPLEHQG